MAYDNQAAGQLITARLFPGVPAADAAVPGRLRLLHLCAAAGAGPARVHDAARGAGRGASGRRAGVHRSAVHAGCASVPPSAHLALQLAAAQRAGCPKTRSTSVLCVLRQVPGSFVQHSHMHRAWLPCAWVTSRTCTPRAPACRLSPCVCCTPLTCAGACRALHMSLPQKRLWQRAHAIHKPSWHR